MTDDQIQAAAETVLANARISLFPGVAFDVTDERELPAASAWLAHWVRRVLDQAEVAADRDEWEYADAFAGAAPIPVRGYPGLTITVEALDDDSDGFDREEAAWHREERMTGRDFYGMDDYRW